MGSRTSSVSFHLMLREAHTMEWLGKWQNKPCKSIAHSKTEARYGRAATCSVAMFWWLESRVRDMSRFHQISTYFSFSHFVRRSFAASMKTCPATYQGGVLVKARLVGTKTTDTPKSNKLREEFGQLRLLSCVCFRFLARGMSIKIKRWFEAGVMSFRVFQITQGLSQQLRCEGCRLPPSVALLIRAAIISTSLVSIRARSQAEVLGRT